MQQARCKHLRIFIKSALNLKRAENMYRAPFLFAWAHLRPVNQSHASFAVFSLAVQAVLIGVFLVYATVEKYGITTSALYGQTMFSLYDGGYMEGFGYFLEVFSAGMFLSIALFYRQYQWLCWSIIFVLIFFDDAYQAHEHLGHYLINTYGLSNAAAEFLGFGIYGLSVAGTWLAGLFLTPRRKEQINTYRLFSGYLLALIFFGVFFDALHSFLEENYGASETVFTLIEDGAEALLITLCAITVLGLWFTQQHNRFSKQ